MCFIEYLNVAFYNSFHVTRSMDLGVHMTLFVSELTTWIRREYIIILSVRPIFKVYFSCVCDLSNNVLLTELPRTM